MGINDTTRLAFGVYSLLDIMLLGGAEIFPGYNGVFGADNRS
jgi:hypothetical protein